MAGGWSPKHWVSHLLSWRCPSAALHQALSLLCQTPQPKHLLFDQFPVTQGVRKKNNIPLARVFSSPWINAYNLIWHQWELCHRSRAVNGLMERITMLSCVHTASQPSCGTKDLPLGWSQWSPSANSYLLIIFSKELLKIRRKNGKAQSMQIASWNDLL